ncbi:MAG: phosphatidate cytidylyltransferase [Prevotellaceae bacterium]|jgi:phosphatidate cytidylyltransferase|nr:phosphatidate cytidylyltransferase [Prevotellaceae bacterium]
MQINRNFLQRTASGIVLVAVIVGAVVWNFWVFAGLFLVVTVLGIKELHGLTSEQTPWSRGAAMLCGSLLFVLLSVRVLPQNPAVLWGIAPVIGLWLTMLYLLIVIGVLIAELFLNRPNPIASFGYFLLSQAYVALPFGLLSQTLFVGGEWQPVWALALFVMIWVNDTFAYLVGTLCGRHRMFERISPKKSWEGFFGGAVGTVIAAYCFALAEENVPLWQWVVLSQIVVVFGTLGDLTESLIKRTTGRKDSGKTLPGHGGILDRFDSLLLAAPVVWLFLTLLHHLPKS